MYTPISLRLLDQTLHCFDGHAWDISEGGIQFELDREVPAGTAVAIQIMLPTLASELGPGRSIFVLANIVWADADPDEPGPVRHAAAFTSFARLGDKERLMRSLVQGRYARAA